MLCRDSKSLASTGGYGQFHEQFDRTHWQHVVHNDASQFLTLCKELEVLPDVWSLHEWSVWRTPSTFKNKRFETAFFVTALEQEPSVHIEPNEVKDCAVSGRAVFMILFKLKFWLLVALPLGLPSGLPEKGALVAATPILRAIPVPKLFHFR